MKIYSKAPDLVAKRVQKVMKQYHESLSAVGVQINCLSIVNTDPDEPALLLHGYPCYAVIKILGAKDRCRGIGDAEIVFDEAKYMEFSSDEQDALIDHELTHLAVKYNKHGRAKFDPYKRPELEMKLHDRSFGWFDQVAKRHGQNSIECKQAMNLVLSGKQIYLNFDMKTKLGDGIKASVKLVD